MSAAGPPQGTRPLGGAARSAVRGEHASAGRLKPIVLAAVLAFAVVVAAYLKRSDVYLLTLYCVYLMATMGLNLTVGYAGQMSLGHAAFFGIGAYHAAILLKLGWPFLLVLPVASVSCFVLGLALGFPALRVQHHYLAFATLGFNVLAYLVMRNEEKLTGGTYGISAIPRPTLLGVDLGGHLAYFYFTLASLFVLALLLWWLLRSPWGRAFAALRDNPIRAESLGVNITAYTLLAFAIGAACAGIGGVYFASLVEFIEPGPFHFSTSLTMLLAVIVGGSGRFFGPMVGTAIIVLLPEMLRASSAPWLKFMQTWYLLVFGVAVVVLMVWLPGGLLSIPERFRRKKRIA
jgi:branched-chain amino acid transport system permease protein